MKKTNKYLSLLALSIAGGCIYQIPYIKYILYNTQLEAMNITNKQSGLLLAFYTIGTMLLYIPGGIITDKFSPKKLLVYSLAATSCMTFLHVFTVQIFGLSLVIWMLLSVTTAFVFWSALIKGIRMIGTSEEQGRMYGLYYAGNGISLAIANYIAIRASALTDNPVLSYKYAVIVCGIVTAISCIGVIFLFVENKDVDTSVLEEDKFQFQYLIDVIKNPIVWVLSIIIFCSFGLFSNLSYLTPYLSNVIGISEEQSGFVSILRQNLSLLLAPVGGILADKVFRSTSKLFIFAFVAVAVVIIGLLFIPIGVNPIFISLYTLLIGALVMMAYGIQFSIISEVKIPTLLTGTVIGLASVIGYSPDFFLSPLFGSWLDNVGDLAYKRIFIFLAALALTAAALSFVIRKYSTSKNQSKA